MYSIPLLIINYIPVTIELHSSTHEVFTHGKSLGLCTGVCGYNFGFFQSSNDQPHTERALKCLRQVLTEKVSPCEIPLLARQGILIAETTTRLLR